ncbi:MAG: hypothetical protein QNJ73_12740 [Gammaproteobacteria bacterium]|nr:hypothetical protein [Gammaproteobacteria bacterium]
MQRRRFIADAVKLTLGARSLALLGGAQLPAVLAESHAAALSPQEMQTLALMARALLPHDFVTDAQYAGVATALERQATRDTGLLELIRAGLARMDALTDVGWQSVSVDQKLQVLEELQDEPFFGAILNATIDTLYRDPEVYRQLGYEGSSIEFGGYLNRGFDDIDWLPASDDATAS